MRRLGSTEIAAVAGFYLPQLAAELPKTKTITDVWLRLLFGFDAPRNANMTRGLDMEPWSLNYYAEHISQWWRPIPLGEFWTVEHPRFPDFTASPDAYFSGGVIEIKTQSEWARKQWGMPGTDEMANRYLYQCAWLMACCDRDETHVLCVFGNDVPVGEPSIVDAQSEHVSQATEFVVTEPAVYRATRDAEIENMLLGFGQRFMDEFVRPRVPPPVKPANNRRKAKEAINAEHGEGAAAEWYERCEAREQQLAAAEAVAGDEAGGGDGVR